MNLNKNPFTEICQAAIGFVAVVFILIGIVTVYLGVKGDPIFAKQGVRKRAIEKEFAHYDTKTGAFTWDNEDAMYVIQGSAKK